MSITNRVIVLCGNDGTGKTTIISKLNYNNHIVVARDNLRSQDFLSDFAQKMNTDEQTIKNVVKFFDTETLEYTFYRNRPSLPTLPNTEIYWFILDCDESTSNTRINNRNQKKEIWDTPKSVSYFRKRFQELSAYYGVPLISTDCEIDETIKNIVSYLENNSEKYKEHRLYALQNLTCESVVDNSIEKILLHHKNEILSSLSMQNNGELHNIFDFTTLKVPDFLKRIELYEKYNIDYSNVLFRFCVTRFILENKQTIAKGEYDWKSFPESVVNRMNDKSKILFICVKEGESKQIFFAISKLFNNKCFIRLKPTIYSHSKQASGEISNLHLIRGSATQMFMEMIWRNNMNKIEHSYIGLNCGLILSHYLENPPQTEIVIKRSFVGTDKHSYYGYNGFNKNSNNSELNNGLYVRFDWRNPNHIDPVTKVNVAETQYYFTAEECVGKDNFYQSFIKESGMIPLGDKTISEDLLYNMIDTKKTREMALKMFLIMQSYLRKIDITIIDCCFMMTSGFNNTEPHFFSEINQDCCRFVSSKNESLDKDIWRTGGSSSKDKITMKWIEFNEKLCEYFKNNKFHETEMLNYTQEFYQNEVKDMMNDQSVTIPNKYKSIYDKFCRHQSTDLRIIATMDLYNGKPVLVKSGKVYMSHSDGDYNKALEKISIFPDVLVVDLNGAFGDKNNNRDIVKEIAMTNYIYTGGGIRTIEDVQDVLKSSAKRIVIGSNFDDGFLKQIDSNRLIIELSIDDNYEVIIKGRTERTNKTIFEYMEELAKNGINFISITFHSTEGHMHGFPRKMVSEIVLNAPNSIKNIAIAGGVSSLDDLNFLWSFGGRVVPQLGSAIWKNALSIGDIYCSMVKFDENGLIPASIVNDDGKQLAIVYLNREALMKTCETRSLWRYSREHKQLMEKGNSSGNYQKIIHIATNCNNDSLMIKIASKNNFCHLDRQSCYRDNSRGKTNMQAIFDHIEECEKKGTGYTAMMYKNPALTLAKMVEEMNEVICSLNKNEIINESSDLLVHLLIFLSSNNIKLNDIVNLLQARRFNPNLIRRPQLKKKDIFAIGIHFDKYASECDKFLLNKFGIRILRPQKSSRSLKISFEIVDNDKYMEKMNCYLNGKQLVFIPEKPKDIPMQLAWGAIDACVTYDNSMSQFDGIYNEVDSIIDNDICLALIKRKNKEVKFSQNDRILIGAEYPKLVHKHLDSMNIDQALYTIRYVTGSSESLLVNSTTQPYDVVSAIVETGKTLDENDLEVFSYVIPKGQMKIGFFTRQVV
ncbi:bifunctional phosphoribosyl-AMP cyclohydrolase/phosphoribosyl-ATP pyrophosphatase protein [Bodo saltans virus]|uniref:Bifunctional phosphoribosyl-AMP cyclohydrolase/phosphoribosyl-ATP pyrophosphatase protein n=1 Tax=Bodo saltans virus TaxID=2024608 RepID=A0A2H4UVM0_9VIRU|nr:bifunctional phosphoribosyl-AMP cyclohydrolase/phosphoribosyl-ATP pyrophosphatase protein [Bodo saltans virus]ATZ80961.1 bifunctional phosphoribosyl-AMP cyclohydrolase/phosphoribosyl-ATP pyrophosphatase protein [Bodo saltans virus]